MKPPKHDKGPRVPTGRREIAEFIASDRDTFLDQWRALALVPAPSGHETARAALVADWVARLPDVATTVDRAGNIVADVPGAQPRGPTVTYLATLDDLDTIAELRRQTTRLTLQRGRIIGPCVQATSSVATALSLLRFAAPGPRPWNHLTVAFVTGEETGLTGTRALVAERAGALGDVLDIMGGVGTISYHAIGIRALRLTFTGSSRHSLGGGLSAVPDAMARLVTVVHSAVPACWHDDIEIRRVNQLHAGEVFNHSPSLGVVGVDVRATDARRLQALSDEVVQAARAIADECGLAVEADVAVEQPAARLCGGAHHPLVVAAEAATSLTGHQAVLRPWTSSNVNAVLAAGLEGIALEGTARGGQRGTVQEWAGVDGVLAGAAVCCHILGLLGTQ